ncbi:hypothetical protein BDZ97DRAFT_1764586 [Flammula alnicola]|nr:hypothetical protein BDZ97DRAFT_1764586 [Flammula alnicola]
MADYNLVSSTAYEVPVAQYILEEALGPIPGSGTGSYLDGLDDEAYATGWMITEGGSVHEDVELTLAHFFDGSDFRDEEPEASNLSQPMAPQGGDHTDGEVDQEDQGYLQEAHDCETQAVQKERASSESAERLSTENFCINEATYGFTPATISSDTKSIKPEDIAESRVESSDLSITSTPPYVASSIEVRQEPPDPVIRPKLKRPCSEVSSSTPSKKHKAKDAKPPPMRCRKTELNENEAQSKGYRRFYDTNGALTYECIVCPLRSHRLGDMSRHVGSHRGTLRCRCNVCGKIYARVDSLKRHQIDDGHDGRNYINIST